MITRIDIGKPFNTGAASEDIAPSSIFKAELPDEIEMSHDAKTLTMALDKDDNVYGLGETVRGFNKRGFRYVSDNADNPDQHENRSSLYGSHNFVIVDGAKCLGIFVDYPAKVTFDIGFTRHDVMMISVEEADYKLYLITAEFTVGGSAVSEIIRQFRELIGPSYKAPYWAFGFHQSRWGYKNEDDIREVVRNYRENGYPLDAVYMDIDYMDDYKSFTLNEESFPNFTEFVEEMAGQGIHLLPNTDPGIKIEEGYDVYEEGRDNDYFCKDIDGEDFVVGVWPGRCCLTDFLNPAASKWFGHKYSFFINAGVDGFWNDMNEPALFYSDGTLNEVFERLPEFADHEMSLGELWEFEGMVRDLANNPEDYRSFYHNTPQGRVRHDRVHNLYGFYMTKSAAEAFKEIAPDKEMLIFSRSSYIGMHRYAGIWTGDNASKWSHIELMMHQLPGLNMCGFLYCGCDMGGFGDDVTEDLMMRYIQLCMFLPLMRNHSALGTRQQELYRFSMSPDYVKMLMIRYAMIPYLYKSYVDAIKYNKLMFTPLSIAYPLDKDARHVEDQLMVGESIMIAPIYQPNVAGRYVYLPEDMKLLKCRSNRDYTEEKLTKGHHFIRTALNEVLIFVRNDGFKMLDKEHFTTVKDTI